MGHMDWVISYDSYHMNHMVGMGKVDLHRSIWDHILVVQCSEVALEVFFEIPFPLVHYRFSFSLHQKPFLFLS